MTAALSFNQLRQEHPYLSGPERAHLFEMLPDLDRDICWKRLAIQARDRHYLNGHLPLAETRQPKRGRPTRRRTPTYTYRTGDPLKDIPAEVYLDLLAPETEPARGRCHCPLPDHDDRNPSASYRNAVWYCHRCATGGDIYTLAATITGITPAGETFRELRRWIAERLLGEVAA